MSSNVNQLRSLAKGFSIHSGQSGLRRLLPRMFDFAVVFVFISKNLRLIKQVGEFSHWVLARYILYFIHNFTFYHRLPLIINN